MTMMEMFEAGYTVVVGSMFGDVTLVDPDEVLDYSADESLALVEVDETAQTAYYYEQDEGQYDD